MSKFLTELEQRCCQENENLWELLSPLVYQSDMLRDPASSSSMSGVVEIPKGFICDGSSTRHIPLVSFIWGSTAHREGFLHDYFFRTNSIPVVSFAMANSLFLEAMDAREKSIWVKYPMWIGVWLGGYFSYHKKTVNWKPSDKTMCGPDPTSSELVKP